MISLFFRWDPGSQVWDGILSKRSSSLKIREISFDFIFGGLNLGRNFKHAVELLRIESGDYKYALVFVDWEGSGLEKKKKSEEIEADLKKLIERLKKEFPDYIIIGCSSESELALREAAKHELIKYILKCEIR